MATMSREQKADVALWDYGSRNGATAKSVEDNMMKDGFTTEEIIAAVKRMSGVGDE